MDYLKVEWIHEWDGEPMIIYSEMDSRRNEVRKIEVFRDGQIGYAIGEIAQGGTYLSETPLPSLQNIASDQQFRPHVITQQDFERVWKKEVECRKTSIL